MKAVDKGNDAAPGAVAGAGAGDKRKAAAGAGGAVKKARAVPRPPRRARMAAKGITV